MLIQLSLREHIYALNVVLLIQLVCFTLIYYYTEKDWASRKKNRYLVNLDIVNAEDYDYYEYDAEVPEKVPKPIPKIKKNIEGNPKLLIYNPDVCKSEGKDITLLYIYSEPSKLDNRNLIRRTYGNQVNFGCFNLRTVFVLGLPPGVKEVQHDILIEQKRHNDLVVGDFIENYRNLSWKGLTAFNFIQQSCKEAKFLIKSDDDTVIDVGWILKKLHQEFANRKQFMFGLVRSAAPPRRCRPKHRWCVSRMVYPASVYPDYCLGNGFAFSADLVAPMYEHSFKVPIHPVDDIYITGILLDSVPGKQLIDLGPSFLEPLEDLSVHRLRLGDELIVAHLAGIYEMEQAWESINNRYSSPVCAPAPAGSD